MGEVVSWWGRPSTEAYRRGKKHRVKSTGDHERKRIGRPPIHTEGYTKATVILLNKQIAFLDRLAADIRQNAGTAITRSEIIRVLIDLLTESGVDLTAAKSEEEFKAILKERMKLGG